MSGTKTAKKKAMPASVPIDNWLKDQDQRRPHLQADIAGRVAELRVERALQVLRESVGRSQTELAEAAGVKQPMIARLEAGRVKNPGILTIAKLANALGQSMIIAFRPMPGPRFKAAFKGRTSVVPTPAYNARGRRTRKIRAKV